MKQIKWLFCSMFLMLVLAACGDSNNSDSSTTKSTGEPASNSATGGEIQDLKLRLGLVVGEWSPHYKAAQAFADTLVEQSGGKIEMQIFPDGQLGGEREMLEAVQSGSLDVGLISSAVYSSFDPKFTVLDIPYLVSDFDEAEALMDSQVGTELNAIFEGIGIHNLGWGHNDFRIITNNKKLVKTPEDLKGIKMRVPESTALSSWFQEQGALSTVMQFPDIYAALQQKVIDGQDNGAILSFAAKFYEHQNYVTVSNHAYSPVGFFINADLWNSLNVETQAVIEQAAKKAVDVERIAIAEFVEVALTQMEGAGIEVHRLTEEELAKFKATSDEAIEKIRQDAGDELVDLLLSQAKNK